MVDRVNSVDVSQGPGLGYVRLLRLLTVEISS